VAVKLPFVAEIFPATANPGQKSHRRFTNWRYAMTTPCLHFPSLILRNYRWPTIQNEGVFGTMNALSQDFARFFCSSEHAQWLREEQRALKVFEANFRCHAEELCRTF